MKKVILFAFALTCTLASWAQQAKPTFSFNKTVHDFGDIKEEVGKLDYSFEFKNTGSLPLVIHNVRASCGCTSPEWSKQPIAPGAKGFVKVTFDPANRPGNFNKTITVTSNTEEANTVLRITGNVTAKPQTVEDLYPRVVGSLRFKSTHISFTRIGPDEKKSEDVEMINTSDKAVSIDFERVPSHVTIKATPQYLKPGEKGIITATYDATINKEWGFVYDQIFLKLDGEVNYKDRLSINANIQEDFANWSQAQKDKAAKISVENKVFDFGEMKQGEKVSHSYVVINEGKSDLIIRKVKASCGCTAITPEKTVIAPGQKTTIKAEFDSTGKTGRQNKSITVITNDPMASNILLRIEGTVK